MDQGGSSGGGDKWLKSEYVLKREIRGLLLNQMGSVKAREKSKRTPDCLASRAEGMILPFTYIGNYVPMSGFRLEVG